MDRDSRNDRRDAYFAAVYHADGDALRVLLRSETTIRTSRDAIDALQTAIERGSADIAYAFFADGMPANVRGDGAETPLIWAARTGQAPVVEFLLAHGADVNASDAVGMTALLYAAHVQHLPIVQRLVAAGANVDHRNNQGQSALELSRLRPFTIKLPGFAGGWGVRRTIRDSAVASYLSTLTASRA